MESPRSGPLFKALAPALGSTSSSRAAGRRQLDMGKSDGHDKNAPWCVRDPRAFVVPPRLRTPPSIAKTRPHHEDSNGDDDNGYDRRVGSVDARRSGDEMSTFPREVEWEAFPSTILTDRVPQPSPPSRPPPVRVSAPPSPRARRPRRASSNSCLRLLFCLLSPLGTGTRLVRVGGELVAIAHTVKPTGYKAPNAYGSRTRFDGSTTNGVANKKVRTIGETSAARRSSRRTIRWRRGTARRRRWRTHSGLGSRFRRASWRSTGTARRCPSRTGPWVRRERGGRPTRRTRNPRARRSGTPGWTTSGSSPSRRS